MTLLNAVVLVLVAAGVGASSVRWLRVAQREHYLAGEASRAAWRWWGHSPDNAAVGTAGIAAAAGAFAFAPVALVSAAAAAAGPIRLSLRGRTSRLAWTRRLTTLAAVVWLVCAAGIGAGAVGAGLAGAVPAAAVLAMLMPVVVDVALVLTGPFEDALAQRFVRRAALRLEEVHPLVVAVTGSYGKTTTKGYIAHLVGPHKAALASPKSYNNRAGLARTVNEHLEDGTQVFIAEMGTYGPGEIAAMCSWVKPEISVITAIGPAHLQRFRSLERTLAAKAEIAERARVVVLNADDARLLALAEVLRSAGKTVVEASGSNEVADVAVLLTEEGLELRQSGRRVGVAAVAAADAPTSLTNVACAAAVATELGVPPEAVLAGLATLPVPANRLQRYAAGGGYVVLDDTFNSNPSGARIALAKLKAEPSRSPAGRLVVVTPGMVELGPTQHEENAVFAEAAARVADELIIVARTNREALTEGAARVAGGAHVMAVDRLDQALEWVRATLGPGDAVLYENDLPDHFP